VYSIDAYHSHNTNPSQTTLLVRRLWDFVGI